MSTLTPQISTFITSLETHPRAAELIPLVEQLLNLEDFSAESQLIAILLEICADNLELITDLWILRGTILLEEGFDIRALSTFWDAVHIQPTLLSPWNQVVEIFLQREEIIYASFFLTKARFLFSENRDFLSLLQELSQQISINLRNPPGVVRNTMVDTDPPVPHLPSDKKNPLIAFDPREIFPFSFHNPWKMAQECFKDCISTSSQKDKQSFVTYAHSAMRELLGLDGNFRDGLNQALIHFQLTDYKQPLMRLNHTRSRVAHANYIPSKKEIRKFHSMIQEIVAQYEKYYTG